MGFAVLYAVLVPPLQAPDEPDHLLAFAAVAERFLGRPIRRLERAGIQVIEWDVSIPLDQAIGPALMRQRRSLWL